MRDPVSLTECSQFRRSRNGVCRSRRRSRHIHPNVAVMLLAWIMPGENPLHLQLVLTSQRRNLHALPAAPVELPPVIAALHALPIKPPIGKRYAPVRTSIPKSKRRTSIRPPKHQRHFQQHRLHQLPPPYLHTPRRRIPKIPQKSRIRSALSLLRGLYVSNEIFFHRHSESLGSGRLPRLAALRLRNPSTRLHLTATRQNAICNGNVVGD